MPRHGVILGDGLPILAHTPSAEGVENLPLLGSTLSVRFALHGTDVDVSGGALAQLEVRPGFVATPQAAGDVVWHGRLDVGQQVALQRAHAH